MIIQPKEDSPTIESATEQEYYEKVYCAYCGARIVGENSWPHDDNCIMKK